MSEGQHQIDYRFIFITGEFGSYIRNQRHGDWQFVEAPVDFCNVEAHAEVFRNSNLIFIEMNY